MSPPLVSLLLPTRNQRDYVIAALDSLLAQSYQPLEILICDDASDDGAFELIRAHVAAYAGPHALRLERNATPLGVGNYNRLMEMARAEFVVVAHSDDIAHPERVARLAAAWQAHGVSMVSSNALIIDPEGRERGRLVNAQNPGFELSLDSLIDRSWNPRVLGAALAWERQVFEVFGPLESERTALSTDTILPFRACLLRGVHYLDEPLLHYRVHPNSRSQHFLHHNRGDDLANQESGLAARTTQLLYMLYTLNRLGDSTVIDATERERLRQRLANAVLQMTGNWTATRNRLITQGHRVRWPKD